MAKKKIPQIVQDIRNYKQKEMDRANEKITLLIGIIMGSYAEALAPVHTCSTMACIVHYGPRMHDMWQRALMCASACVSGGGERGGRAQQNMHA